MHDAMIDAIIDKGPMDGIMSLIGSLTWEILSRFWQIHIAYLIQLSHQMIY